jgi:hypothetical protein
MGAVNTAVNNEQTNEENTVIDKKLSEHITKMNEAIDVSINSNLSMFQVFMSAYNEFGKDIENYIIFKDSINLEESSIRKMEKICGSKVVKENADKLPIAWGTLHAIAIMDQGDITDAIESKVFNSKTTKKQVVEYKQELKAKSDAEKHGTKGDAHVKTDADLIEETFIEQLNSIFTIKGDVDEKGHKAIQKAVKTLNKYYEITSESIANNKKVA